MSSLERITIALTAGGTGGHMFPAAALAKELSTRGYNILILSDRRGMAYEYLFPNMTVICIESKSPMQGGLKQRLASFWGLIKGGFKAAKYLRQYKAKAIVGFGGYATLPAVWGARLLGLPYALHEQNGVLGRVNRLMVGGAKFIAISFKDTRRIKDKYSVKTTLTGNPTREEIVAIGSKHYQLPKESEKFNILVVGGSLGAKIFADIVPAALTFLDKELKSRLNVTQQCREEDQQRVKKAYDRAGIACTVQGFITDMPAALAKAHLIISRAGAGSVTEIAIAGRPAIFVPLAIAADNHQTFNARALSENRAGWSLAENEFSPGPLSRLIGGLFTADDQLVEAATNALNLAHPNATKDLADLLENEIFQTKKLGENKAQIEAPKTIKKTRAKKRVAA